MTVHTHRTNVSKAQCTADDSRAGHHQERDKLTDSKAVASPHEQSIERVTRQAKAKSQIERLSTWATIARQSPNQIAQCIKLSDYAQSPFTSSQSQRMQRIAVNTTQQAATQLPANQQTLRIPEPSIQRTVYKIAAEGPALHQTDPEHYSKLIGDEHIEQSLHQYKPGEIDLSLATSPMTIFMHGTTLANHTAQRLYDFLVARNYQPKPDSDIIFITCKGATLMDEFLLSKGQALANLLGARVHLAHGVVKLLPSGVPYVEKPNGEGRYTFINSKEELTQILKGHSEGWQTFHPDAITCEMLKVALQKGRSQLFEFRDLKIFNRDYDKYRNLYSLYLEELKVDRRHVTERYENVQKISRALEITYRPRLSLFQQLQRTVRDLEQLAEKTTQHHDRAQALIQEIRGWTESVGSGGSVDGFQSLLEDKQVEWIQPLQQAIELEQETPVVGEGSGWEDLDFDFAEPDSAPSHASTDHVTASPDPHRTNSDTSQLRQLKPPQSNTIQRQIIADDTPLANGKTLRELLANLPDIDLVQANHGLNLTVRFVPLRDTFGVTRLKANGSVVIPEDHIKPENAQQSYTIEIELNREYYANGQHPDYLGSMIETLTHEWTLHGAQHAVNINNIRHDLAPSVKVDHEHLFTTDMNSMDFAIALQIHREKQSPLGKSIYESYLNDVRSHQQIVQKGWDGDNIIKGTLLCQQFGTLLATYQAIENNPLVNASLKETLGRIQEIVSWYFGEPPIYRDLASTSDIDSEELLQCINNLGAIDLANQPAATVLLPAAIQTSRPLLKELAEVKKIQSIADPAAARKRALQSLSVDTDAFDNVAGPSRDHDVVDYKASSKKFD